MTEGLYLTPPSLSPDPTVGQTLKSWALMGPHGSFGQPGSPNDSCGPFDRFIFDVVFIQAVHQQILSNKFLIVRMRELLWRKEECQKFYQEHEGRINSPLNGTILYPKMRAREIFSWIHSGRLSLTYQLSSCSHSSEVLLYTQTFMIINVLKIFSGKRLCGSVS